MSAKSELTQAAYSGDLEGLRQLLADGAVVDGSDNDCFQDEAPGCLTGAPFALPLSEAARAGHLEAVDTLLDAGAPVDGVNHCNETAFLLAAQKGRVEVVQRLLAAGAEVNHVGCSGGCVRMLLHFDLANNKDSMLQLLLDAGANPALNDHFGQNVLLDFADLPERLVDSSKRRRKSAKKRLERLKKMAAHWPQSDAELTQLLNRCSEARNQSRSTRKTDVYDQLRQATRQEGWLGSVREVLDATAEGRGVELTELVHRVLKKPEAVAHPDWGEAIEALMDLTPSYADITEDVYGQRLDPGDAADDEGGVVDNFIDDHLCTADYCLLALATPKAIQREDWADVLRYVCTQKEARVGSMPLGDDEAVALFALPEVKAHQQHDRLFELAAQAFLNLDD